MFYIVHLALGVYIFVNDGYRKPKWQTEMDNPDTLAAPSIQDTDDDQQKKQTQAQKTRKKRERQPQPHTPPPPKKKTS